MFFILLFENYIKSLLNKELYKTRNERLVFCVNQKTCFSDEIQWKDYLFRLKIVFQNNNYYNYINRNLL